MNRKIDLLALDLDGTALRSDNTLSPAVKAAIEKAAASGIEVVVASGRPFSSMPREVLEISGIRYVIASNGAAVYKDGERVRSVLLRENDVVRLLEATEKHDLIWEAFLEGEVCTDSRYYNNPVKYGCGEAYVEYVRSSRAHRNDMRDFIRSNRSRLDSVEFVCTDKALRKQLWQAIEKEVPGLYITSSSENFVEFMDSRATKSNAVKWLCESLGISPENAAAAGNADNDADMLAFAGLGAAVENACELCRSNAEIIVPDNDSDGVAQLIDIILKLNEKRTFCMP